MRKNTCVAWINSKSIESLNSQMSFYAEAANVFGYEDVHFYGDKDNQSIELMLDEVLTLGVKTIIVKSIKSLCRNLELGISIARKIFQNNITIVNVGTTEEMKNMSDFIRCLFNELLDMEIAYNMQDEWPEYSFDEIFSNDLEYAELCRMDEGVN